MALRPARPEHGIAWVTGAGSGLGRALTLELVAAGWRVAASSRTGPALEKLASEHPDRILAVPCDVREQGSVADAAAVIRRAGHRVGLLVANAGIYLPVDLAAIDVQAFEDTFRTNLLGTVHLLEAVVPDMVAREEGHVHLVSSATAFGGMPTAGAYGASKIGLVYLAQCLELELARHGVGVSVCMPGFIRTPAQDANTFPKPFMMEPRTAARRIARQLRKGRFMDHFPRRFTGALAAIYALPSAIKWPLVRGATGWSRRPPDEKPQS